MLSDQNLSLIAWLFEENRAPAILLYPPYPPHPAIRVRSKIGGRPSLPAAYPWPIGKLRGKPTPLHFLAQIDCAELPRFGHGLPATGVLFFFACDMDQAWDAETPTDDACVLYVEKMPLDVTDREPPADLTPIREAYASNGKIVAHGCLPGEAGPKIHVEWPLMARKVDSWPSAGAFEDIGNNLERAFPGRALSAREVLSFTGDNERKYHAAARLNREIAEAYNERVRLKRFEAFVAATGITSDSSSYDLPGSQDTSQYREPWAADGVRFPQLGIMIERLARHAIKDALSRRKSPASDLRKHHEVRTRTTAGAANGWIERARQAITGVFSEKEELPDRNLRPDDSREHQETQIRAIIDAANGWIARAREIGSLGQPSEADVDAFNTWLADVHGKRGAGPWGPQRSGLNLDTDTLVRAALIDTVNALASSAPEKFPARYYEELAGGFTPFRSGGNKLEQHQMLGHVPSSQNVKLIDDPTICLLQLSSEAARYTNFGDAGECTFWIKGRDLAARRFDKAWATIEGG